MDWHHDPQFLLPRAPGQKCLGHGWTMGGRGIVPALDFSRFRPPTQPQLRQGADVQAWTKLSAPTSGISLSESSVFLQIDDLGCAVVAARLVIFGSIRNKSDGVWVTSHGSSSLPAQFIFGYPRPGGPGNGQAAPHKRDQSSSAYPSPSVQWCWPSVYYHEGVGTASGLDHYTGGAFEGRLRRRASS